MVISSPTAARSVVSITCTAVSGSPALFEAFVHAGGDRLIGMDRFRAAAQDRGVAGLQAQPGGVGGDVGARFVDDADHAQRHAHLADLDAGGAVFQVADLADRVGQLGDLAQAFGHARHALVGEREPVDHRRLEAFGARGVHVLPVGFQQARAVALDGGGHAQERGVLGPSLRARHLARSAPRLAADTMHVGLDVHVSSGQRKTIRG